jgi:hypothetical protein
LIAEARVLVTPDTTTFRALLTAELASATKAPIPVNVTPVVTRGASSSALAGAAAAQTAANKQITASSTAAAAAQARLAKADDIVAVGARRAAAAANEVAAAQITLRAAINATTTTFSAYGKALETTDLLLIKQTRDAYAAAKANEALALSNLQAARTEQIKNNELAKGAGLQTLRLQQASKGAASAALSFIGLRGATLAAGGAFLTGAAAIIAFGRALGTAAQLETSLNVFQATTDATADQMERIREVSIGLGRD